MKTIDQVLSDVLHREGWPAVTDRPSDLGGLTKGGVTLSNYNVWRVSIGRPPINAQELRDLSEADARAFFQDQFSRPFAFVGDEGIFVLLVDWAITSGPDEPMKALQAALKLHGSDVGAIDGVAGTKTRAAWKLVEGDFDYCHQLETQLLTARADFYVGCVLHDPVTAAFLKATPTSQLANLRGWIRRTLEFL